MYIILWPEGDRRKGERDTHNCNFIGCPCERGRENVSTGDVYFFKYSALGEWEKIKYEASRNVVICVL